MSSYKEKVEQEQDIEPDEEEEEEEEEGNEEDENEILRELFHLFKKNHSFLLSCTFKSIVVIWKIIK